MRVFMGVQRQYSQKKISGIGEKAERGVVLPFFFVTSYIDFTRIDRI